MNQSNSQSHYEIFSHEYGYQFNTESGNLYIITFVPYPPVIEFLNIETYMFNIERVELNDSNKRYDEKVRNTIIFLIKEFFNEHQRALITLCDIGDNRQLCRHKLFNKWYDSFNDGLINKIDSEVLIDTNKSYTSLLYRKDLKDDKELKENFYKLVGLNLYS